MKDCSQGYPAGQFGIPSISAELNFIFAKSIVAGMYVCESGPEENSGRESMYHAFMGNVSITRINKNLRSRPFMISFIDKSYLYFAQSSGIYRRHCHV
jgi:hypothetical protein